MMATELAFTAGGALAYRTQGAQGEATGVLGTMDVTRHAVAYLWEPVHFDGEVCVRDTFSLLEANPILLDVFARLHAAAFLAEAKDGTAVPYTGEYNPDGIEYLELYFTAERDAATGALVESHQLWLRAVGYELRDDVRRGAVVEFEKGNRIPWSIMFMPVTDLLNIPLRFNPVVSVDTGAGDHGAAAPVLVAAPTLGQVIHGVLWELAFNGPPEQRNDSARQVHSAAGC
ncbi:hypothetical protein [Cupriavidus numazuensis]|uniref:Uncharacterized protein n=1 Tax=Cupriavidus numazuensis TaxID=221992 RepID=A0ABN7QAC4_9BURK|nr:hypothetical protein [Cupriavidus numazuensis]CAG2160399.1 hypothetical protein LMG26411_07460 [Cupriavidus numazuensis]